MIVLLFEASKEKGPIVWNALYEEMENVDGFVDMIYEHKYGDKWPTMGDLVKNNKRIIVFYFNGGSCTDDVCPPGFKYFYNYAADEFSESKLQAYWDLLGKPWEFASILTWTCACCSWFIFL